MVAGLGIQGFWAKSGDTAGLSAIFFQFSIGPLFRHLDAVRNSDIMGFLVVSAS